MVVVRIVVLFLALAGLSLFFAGDVSTVEVIAALICGAAGTGFSVALNVVAKKHFSLSPPAKVVLKPFGALVPEYLVVGRALVAVAVSGAPRQRGAFVHQPFDFGGNDARSASRRALTVIGVSLAPRTFVIRGENGDALLLHGFPDKAPSPDTEWPV